jgi:nitrite reductase/ring-hydroxylating ferredoxin subunit
MTKVIIPLPSLTIGQSIAVQADGRRLLICRSATGLHVMDEFCPHQLKSLEGGRIRGNSFFCPHHGARFSLEDGRSLSTVTGNGLKLRPCAVSESGLEVELE